jgi:hypothetical protein
MNLFDYFSENNNIYLFINIKLLLDEIYDINIDLVDLLNAYGGF